MYLPIQSMQHEHPGVKYLQEATLIFQNGGKQESQGLQRKRLHPAFSR